jgi:hypothetical protein
LERKRIRMSDYEKTPELEKINVKKKKLIDFQKDYNISSKSFVHIIGQNITLFVCLLLPILLIGFIWTDFGAPRINIKLVSDAIVTIALFVIGETMMMRIGSSGGRLDSDYITAKTEFESLVAKVNEIGTMFMPLFCEWQIDVEMKQAITTRLRYLRFTQADWDKVKDMSNKDLVQRYGVKKARKIFELNRLEPVELTESILLYNNNDLLSRGGVPISGEEYMYKRTHSAKMLMSALFTGLLTVSVAITLTSDISFSRVMYTAFKLIVLLYRMAQGYDVGARAYNTVEVKQLKAKNTYLRQYVRFVDEKTYLKLGDKYGDFNFITEETPTND